MAQLGIRTESGSFNWDYLRGTDLTVPERDSFLSYYVYKTGTVHLQEASAAELHNFCLKQKIPVANVKAEGPRVALAALGFVVEEVFRKEHYNAARHAFGNELAKREGEFRTELFEQEGVSGNPRAEACYSKAYDKSHSVGFQEVASTFIDLVELIR